MRRAVVMLLALAVPLAGCGRAGPPRPPGPKEQVIYPRGYPKRDTVPIAPGGSLEGSPMIVPDTGALAPLGTRPGAAPNTPEVPPALR